jgi:aerobic-type carbon monoxide dehydrogenase small subunit (CoxS/CutS family)
MKLTVNGVPHEVASPPVRPLLHVLRDELDVTGPKAGCQQGSCGTCTVLVDGEPRRSCLVPLAMADGADITTIEGLGDARRLSAIQAAFYHYYGSQCGFCTPGMVVAAYALLERTPSPSRAEIQEALGGHMCRCTGYVKIVAAVEAVARGESFDEADRTHHPEPGEPEVAMKGAPA